MKRTRQIGLVVVGLGVLIGSNLMGSHGLSVDRLVKHLFTDELALVELEPYIQIDLWLDEVGPNLIDEEQLSWQQLETLADVSFATGDIVDAINLYQKAMEQLSIIDPLSVQFANLLRKTADAELLFNGAPNLHNYRMVLVILESIYGSQDVRLVDILRQLARLEAMAGNGLTATALYMRIELLIEFELFLPFIQP